IALRRIKSFATSAKQCCISKVSNSKVGKVRSLRVDGLGGENAVWGWLSRPHLNGRSGDDFCVAAKLVLH
ncbi:MAG: hypothetical protein WBH14_08780, partial [Albidovulum sp.]